jgi:hypothetical protein
MSEKATVSGCKAVRDSSKDKGKTGALLIKLPEGKKIKGQSEVWVPHSVIHDDSEVYDAKGNNEGKLVVQRWWADKQGWT